MKVLVDQQLPPALAAWLVTQGIDAVHVRDIGLSQASDRQICEAALSRKAAVLTKDDDFVRLLHTMEGPAIVWVRLGNCSNAVLLERVRGAWAAIVSRLESGERLVEVR